MSVSTHSHIHRKPAESGARIDDVVLKAIHTWAADDDDGALLDIVAVAAANDAANVGPSSSVERTKRQVIRT